jgi:hypothetical protein
MNFPRYQTVMDEPGEGRIVPCLGQHTPHLRFSLDDADPALANLQKAKIDRVVRLLNSQSAGWVDCLDAHLEKKHLSADQPPVEAEPEREEDDGEDETPKDALVEARRSVTQYGAGDATNVFHAILDELEALRAALKPSGDRAQTLTELESCVIAARRHLDNRHKEFSPVEMLEHLVRSLEILTEAQKGKQ